MHTFLHSPSYRGRIMELLSRNLYTSYLFSGKGCGSRIMVRDFTVPFLLCFFLAFHVATTYFPISVLLGFMHQATMLFSLSGLSYPYTSLFALFASAFFAFALFCSTHSSLLFPMSCHSPCLLLTYPASLSSLIIRCLSLPSYMSYRTLYRNRYGWLGMGVEEMDREAAVRR